MNIEEYCRSVLWLRRMSTDPLADRSVLREWIGTLYRFLAIDVIDGRNVLSARDALADLEEIWAVISRE